jgi:hypothetical protein
MTLIQTLLELWLPHSIFLYTFNQTHPILSPRWTLHIFLVECLLASASASFRPSIFSLRVGKAKGKFKSSPIS